MHTRAPMHKLKIYTKISGPSKNKLFWLTVSILVVDSRLSSQTTMKLRKAELLVHIKRENLAAIEWSESDVVVYVLETSWIASQLKTFIFTIVSIVNNGSSRTGNIRNPLRTDINFFLRLHALYQLYIKKSRSPTNRELGFWLSGFRIYQEKSTKISNTMDLLNYVCRQTLKACKILKDR